MQVMASLPVYDRSGKEVGTYEIEPAEIAARINKQLLHDVVVMYQANKRQGTARTKSRAEVVGSTDKMYRQKGTGRARAGSRKSPIRRGGGHTFAKRPRDYSYRLPKKALRAATRMAIASRIRDREIVVIDDLSFDEPRTRDMVQVIAVLGLAGSATLITTEKYDANVYKSARNIERVSVSPVADLNALLVLSPRRMLVTKAALDAIKSRATANSDAE